MNVSSKLALAAVAALAITAAPAQAATAHPSCAHAHSKTIAQNGYARVYTVKFSQGRRLYGCVRATGRAQLLQSDNDDFFVTSGKLSQVRLAGRFVAWKFTSTDESCKADCPPGFDPTTVSLHIRNLRTRRTTNVAGEPIGSAFLLTTGGAIAWAEQSTNNAVAVFAFDAAGKRSLDSGDIDPKSLTRKGQKVEWTNAGQQKSAALARRD